MLPGDAAYERETESDAPPALADARPTVERLQDAPALLLGNPGAEVPGRVFDAGVDHTVSGNPLRFQAGTFEIRPDEEWRTALPAGKRRLVTALTWPLLKRYGYLGGG